MSKAVVRLNNVLFTIQEMIEERAEEEFPVSCNKHNTTRSLPIPPGTSLPGRTAASNWPAPAIPHSPMI